jgi:hypothetical protein
MILKKAKIVVPLLVIINSLLLFFVWQVPIMDRLKEYVELYREAISENVPSIKISEDGLEFLGTFPYTKVLKNSIVVTIDNKIDTVKFKTFPAKSIWLNNDTLLYRGKSILKIIPLNDIKGDSTTVITGQQINQKVDKFFYIAFNVAKILLFFSTLLIVFLLVLFGAGMGSVVDAFSDGPFKYKDMLTIASWLQFMWIGVAIGGKYFGVLSMSAIIPFLIIYILTIMAYVYYLLKKKITP